MYPKMQYKGVLDSDDLNFTPKAGDIVSAKMSGGYDGNGLPIKEGDVLCYIDNNWYIMSVLMSTNRDWINRLSNKELALFINSEEYERVKSNFEEWLNSPFDSKNKTNMEECH